MVPQTNLNDAHHSGCHVAKISTERHGMHNIEGYGRQYGQQALQQLTSSWLVFSAWCALLFCHSHRFNLQEQAHGPNMFVTARKKSRLSSSPIPAGLKHFSCQGYILSPLMISWLELSHFWINLRWLENCVESGSYFGSVATVGNWKGAS